MVGGKRETNQTACRKSIRPVPLLAFAVAALALGACATSQPIGSQQPRAVSTDVYKVGPVRVMLRPQPEVEFMCRLQTERQTTRTGQILGCYIPREQAIISTPDPQVLLHEFKHYFEGPFHD